MARCSVSIIILKVAQVSKVKFIIELRCIKHCVLLAKVTGSMLFVDLEYFPNSRTSYEVKFVV